MFQRVKLEASVEGVSDDTGDLSQCCTAQRLRENWELQRRLDRAS